MTWKLEKQTVEVVRFWGDNSITVGMHAYNDCGMDVVNSICAVRAGAKMVQGTVNDIVERTWNSNLFSIIPSLLLHVSAGMKCASNLCQITLLSCLMNQLLNRGTNSAAPFVGILVFAHEGGLHVNALKKDPFSYQHIIPELVGNKKRILITKLSGRQNIQDKIRDAGATLGEDTIIFAQ